MKLISRLRDHRFCAFCKASRRVYVKKHADLTNVLGSIIFAITLTWMFWGGPDGRGVGLFCVFIFAAEIFVYLRWRLNLVCGLCGFDPLIYKRSPAEAATKVRQFFDERREDPQFWMTRSPLVELQKKIRTQERQADAHRELREQIARRTKPSLAPTKTL